MILSKLIFFLFKKFKELILSIDQEESKMGDDKTPSSGSKTGADQTKISAIQQKLLDGIEKTKVNRCLRKLLYLWLCIVLSFNEFYIYKAPTGSSSGLDSAQNTPRKLNKSAKKHGNSSCKKSLQKKKKRRRDNSDVSSDESDQYGSDMDEEL